MSVLFVAVPAALAFAISAVVAFIWASRSGQLDDLDTPPLRMLHDEPPRRARPPAPAPDVPVAEQDMPSAGRHARDV
jgi:cbb3-type cytochrome oxidase maturation protein